MGGCLSLGNLQFGRYNARGFDLNRNFPDYFKQNNKRNQPETEAVKAWLSKIQFVLSGSLHGGALVASYPYDNTPNSSMYISWDDVRMSGVLINHFVM